MLPNFYNGVFTSSVSVKGIDPITAPMYEIAKTVGTVFQNPRTQFYICLSIILSGINIAPEKGKNEKVSKISLSKYLM